MDRVDQVLRDFGVRVKTLRVAKEMSQEAFAQQAGIDRSYYGRIERSAANPTLKNIAAIAEALEMPIVELFAELGSQNKRSRKR